MLRRLFNSFIHQKEETSVSASKQSVDKRQFSELNYRNILESMDEGFANCQIMYDKAGKPVDFRYLYINPSFAKLTGLKAEQVTGHTVKEIIPTIEPFWIETYGRVVKSGKSENFENSVKSLGKLFEIKVWRSGEGCFSVVFDDITDKKNIEEKISLQAAALEAAANGVVITDMKGIIQWVNPSFSKLTGYTYQEVFGKSTKILKSGKQDKRFYQKLWNTILSGKNWHGEIINKKKDGSLYTEEQIITPVKDKTGKITSFIAIKHDVTERKKLEEETKRTKEKLEIKNKEIEQSRLALLNAIEDLEEAKKTITIEKAKDEAMLESIGEGLIAVDNERKVMMVNKAAENILDWKGKEMVGRELTSFPLEDEEGHLLPVDKRPTFIAIVTGKTINATYYFVRKDKTRFPIEIIVTPIKLGGKILGAIDIFRDVTHEKAIDKAKSEFVSLASHQLRTPLGIMKWHLEILENDDYFKKAPISIRNHFDEIYKNHDRVLSLVRDLLSVTRIDQGRVKNLPKSANPASVTKKIVEQMQIVAEKKKVALHLKIYDVGMSRIYIDIVRFQEVIENLITNAIEYTAPSGKVDVFVNKVDSSLLISVKDTGIGISPSDQNKLFTKFFRAEKSIEHNPEGSGLGLYIVKSYVEGWGGKISVKSTLGKGSTFIITLPISQKKMNE